MLYLQEQTQLERLLVHRKEKGHERLAQELANNAMGRELPNAKYHEDNMGEEERKQLSSKGRKSTSNKQQPSHKPQAAPSE